MVMKGLQAYSVMRNTIHQHKDSPTWQSFHSTGRTGITFEKMRELEMTVNRSWKKYDIYLIVTGKHLLERLTREEHDRRPITFIELTRILTEFTRRYSTYFGGIVCPPSGYYGVIRESFSHIHMCFVLRPGIGVSGYDRDIMIQTILRKKIFLTQNRIYDV